MVCCLHQWKRVLGKKGINQGYFLELTEPEIWIFLGSVAIFEDFR